jgi:gamma-glutamyltranspeptidase / glutathione hydrolase
MRTHQRAGCLEHLLTLPRILLAAVVLAICLSSGVAGDHDYKRGMVASGHPLATEAGLETLKRGGNAIDAAVAVGLTLGVVDPHNSGIGGGCFLLIRLASGKIVAIDGREKAPAAATKDMFIRDGKADTTLSQTGALASGVPGELAAFDYALRKHGKLTLRELLLPAADIAETGFPLSKASAGRLEAVAHDMKALSPATAIFFKDGRPLKAGDLLKQPDLAATYRAVAEQGIDWFYRGPFGRMAGQWMSENGGILTAEDFATYEVVLREPVQTSYRGYTVISFPPPSSGGVHLVQMLNIVGRFDLKRLDEASRLHVMAEAMKLAFADRAYWLGDPDFASVPRGLLSRRYAIDLAKRIDLNRATRIAGHGEPPNWEKDSFKKHTTHFSVADADGNWVACTATINTSFGSKVVIPGTGVVMNNQMDDFSTQPGVANHFGLVGAEANAIAPGKRPLSSMTPTIVMKNGKPMIALGAAGGPKIISAVFQELIAMLDLGKTAGEAIAEPRIHHQWSPDELIIERTVAGDVRASLERRGHRILEQGALSTSQIVSRDLRSGAFNGAADPRSGGLAKGW